MRTPIRCCRRGRQGLALLVLLLVADARANTGYFTGTGHTITLGKSEQIQLVSEDVTIRPNCGWTPPMDSVDYRCKFVLKNLTAKPVRIQAGFPLNSQFVHEPRKTFNATDLVLDYHFIARDEKTTYHTRFVANDSDKRFSRLFLWDMTFEPLETKVLHVSYQLGISFGETSTRKSNADDHALVVATPGVATAEHAKKWHAALEVSWVEHFYYITETGKSWAGPIEHAVFRIETGHLEDCLAKRELREVEAPVLEGEPLEEYSFSMKAGAVYAEILPEGWKLAKAEPKSQEDWYRNLSSEARIWEYRNYRPGEPLSVWYYIVPFPRSAADCESWVRHMLGYKPAKADLTELREIAAAFYGIAPQSASAKSFVEKQVWYHPTNGLREAELREEQRSVLKRLDEIATAAGQGR